MSTAHLSGIDLLKLGDKDRKRPYINQYWPQFLGVLFGVGSGVILNFGTRRPVFSGIQKHVLFTVGWCTVLQFAQNKRNEYYAEKDAVLRHYIELHKDEFPVPERKKIGDIMEPWIPIR